MIGRGEKTYHCFEEVPIRHPHSDELRSTSGQSNNPHFPISQSLNHINHRLINAIIKTIII